MNTLVYEFRPWAFAAMGLVALYNSAQSPVMYGSSLLLIFTSAVILYARAVYRSNQNKKKFRRFK